MTTTTPHDAELRHRIVTVLRAEVPGVPEDVAEDARLEQFGLNSMKQVEVLFGLEDEFDVQLEEDDLPDDAFDTLADITRLLRSSDA